ncbi:ComEA family DNA-binding protein [Ectothiorhodospira mobilis]|uniref:ComEA family DNA-binding protein n=1 Tax=Ectothiorhodospira mobilis TaxID=195064 RepID=UPI001EE9041A|nr:helix-hairpin-helix domain-containing protein [Ectothiorhodospira mobilis]MCG5535185.1 helix-hairpin-helix domain-containing protein [Ectothiorhodospira mobilis]
MKLFPALTLSVSLLCAAGLTQAADPVNVNRADAEALAAGLHGVGPVKAEAIIAYREAHGPFRSVHELTEVDGIGEATVEQNLDAIHLGEQAAAK